MRTGVIAEKLGMTRLLQDDGTQVAVTVLRMDSNLVVGTRTLDKDGYTAVQVGAGQVKSQRLRKSQKGFFAKSGVEPRKKLREFRVSDDAMLNVGDEILADHFVPGQKVDATGISIGKGFAGVMKRHNFGGMRASHGVSLTHRSHGSTGMCQDPGKVLKGKKMAGQMGNSQVTKQNLVVVSTCVDRGLLMVKGSVPGAKGATIYVSDAVKFPLFETAPFPASIRSGQSAAKVEAVAEQTDVTTEQQTQGE